MRGTIEKSLDHMRFLARFMRGRDVSYAALLVLLELSVPVNHVGSDYLLHAVVAFCKEPLATMRKGIYPAVAAHYEYDVGNEEVEKAISSAIEKAWKNRNETVWKYYFPQETRNTVRRPTNAEFISRIGRVLQLWQECSKQTEN